ncbi:hypothetical protein O181_054579 [Austropuccinia psidii MF-1]|uniref:Uncharacterized protein n=1 Tax=Austropuccinia psidii MF-1 TaxID=1389203 RepID=A0A9Q3E4W9_9BASI|nr:hypothetical protein [Austropuccinia psidii MF-1]
MLASKHTKNACLLCNPSYYTARAVPVQETLVSTAYWLTMIKEFLSRNGYCNPKQADGNVSGRLAWCPQVLILPPPLLGHYPMFTSLLYWRELIIRPMKDVNEQNPPNPPQHYSPVPCIPCKQALRQSTPGLSGTQWSEDLFCNKQKAIPFLILAFDSSELTVPPFVEPSQYDEPPISGLSQSSKSQVPSHEDAVTCDPEPEVDLMKSTEDPSVSSHFHFFLFPTFSHPSFDHLQLFPLPPAP